jgi:hypothetical protein
MRLKNNIKDRIIAEAISSPLVTPYKRRIVKKLKSLTKGRVPVDINNRSQMHRPRTSKNMR